MKKGKEEMVKAMLLKVGIALVLMLLALSFTAEARKSEARWLPVHFEKLPKGAPVPPSAPSGGTNFVPPQAPLPPNSLANSRMMFQHLYLARPVHSIPTPPLT